MKNMTDKEYKEWVKRLDNHPEKIKKTRTTTFFLQTLNEMIEVVVSGLNGKIIIK
ncbi:MAG: hypothetical protein WC341_15130 [Bacteroidales bacterium]|jgi:hypothetical protein